MVRLFRVLASSLRFLANPTGSAIFLKVLPCSPSTRSSVCSRYCILKDLYRVSFLPLETLSFNLGDGAMTTSTTSNETSYTGIPSSPIPATVESVSVWSYILLAIFPIFAVLHILSSPAPWWLTTLKALSVLLPAGLILSLLLYRLTDAGVSKNFVIYQVFLAGFPLYILIAVVELIFTIIAFLLLFHNEVRRVAQADKDAQRQVMAKIFANLPTWKLIAMAFIFAFLVAALCEEAGKFLLARRWRNTGYGDIGLKGIVAVSTAAGLGVATTEHFMATLASGLLSSWFRAVLAFPIHCGTAFLMGVKMAEGALHNMAGVGVFTILLLPISFHGMFDFVALVIAPFAKQHKALIALLPIIQVLIAVVLWVVAYRQYRNFVQKDENETSSLV